MQNQAPTPPQEKPKNPVGRPQGWRLRFRLPYSSIKEKASRLGLNHIRVSIIQERQRTFPEIMEELQKLQEKGVVPTGDIMKELAVEKIQVGQKVSEIVAAYGEDTPFEIGRVDIINHFEGIKNAALALFKEHDLGNDGDE